MRLKELLVGVVVCLAGCAATPEVRVDYYPNGQVRAEWEYVGGMKNGKGIIYDAKGHQTFELHLRNGSLEGEGCAYSYSENRKKCGGILSCAADACKVLYPGLDWTGQMVFKDGYPDGNASTFYHGGKLLSKVAFVKGQRQGIETGYFETGEKHFERQYRDDELNGRAIYYYPTGGIKSVSEYKNGEQTGEFKTYYESGKLKSTATVIKSTRGYRYLNPKEFFENGALQSEAITTDTGTVIKTRLYSEQGLLLKEQFPGTGKGKKGGQQE